MVVFVCGCCGASLKKNQVQTHTFKCRHFQYVSCMDCSKDFGINDYALHTKCITEAEKYGGSNYVAKDASGEKKQAAWISKVHEYVQNEQNIKPRMREILIQLTNFENLPRKQAKFENFARQSVKLNQWDIAEVWEIFNSIIQDDKKSSEKAPSKDLNTNGTVTNGTAKIGDVNGKEETGNENHKKRKIPEEEKSIAMEDESSEPKKKKNKRQKHNDETVNGEAKENGKDRKHKRRKKSDVPESDLSEDEKQSESKKKKKKNKKQKGNVEKDTVNEENEEVKAKKTEDAKDTNDDSLPHNEYGTPFKWKTTITRCLQSSSEKGLKITKLKKLVISEYYAAHGEDEHVKSESELTALLNKKLSHRNDKYVVFKDRVKLRCASE